MDIFKFITENLKNYIYYSTDNGILLNGNVNKLIKLLPDNSINLIVTSPPYNKGFWSRNRNPNNGFKTKSRRIDYGVFDDNLLPDEYEKQQRNLIENCLRILKNDGSFFYNHIDILREHQTIHPLYIYDYPLKQIIIWDRKASPKLDKSYFVPINEWIFWLQKNKKSRTKFKRENAIFKTNIWKINPDKNNSHPAPFPEELPENCILTTTDENDVVFDPYAGSGTTLFVAEKLNRKWLGIELNPEYCGIIKNRLNSFNNINESVEIF